jgi:hypothetical protein
MVVVVLLTFYSFGAYSLFTLLKTDNQQNAHKQSGGASRIFSATSRLPWHSSHDLLQSQLGYFSPNALPKLYFKNTADLTILN